MRGGPEGSIDREYDLIEVVSIFELGAGTSTGLLRCSSRVSTFGSFEGCAPIWESLLLWEGLLRL